MKISTNPTHSFGTRLMVDTTSGLFAQGCEGARPGVNSVCMRTQINKNQVWSTYRTGEVQLLVQGAHPANASLAMFVMMCTFLTTWKIRPTDERLPLQLASQHLLGTYQID
jgi:hypothetical protein